MRKPTAMSPLLLLLLQPFLCFHIFFTSLVNHLNNLNRSFYLLFCHIFDCYFCVFLWLLLVYCYSSGRWCSNHSGMFARRLRAKTYTIISNVLASLFTMELINFCCCCCYRIVVVSVVVVVVILCFSLRDLSLYRFVSCVQVFWNSLIMRFSLVFFPFRFSYSSFFSHILFHRIHCTCMLWLVFGFLV